MASMSNLISRSSALLHTRDTTSGTTTMSTSMLDLLITLMVLLFIAVLLIGALYIVRKIRRSKAIARQSLPQYEERPSTSNRRLTIQAFQTAPYNRSSVYVYDDEKTSLAENQSTPPLSSDSVPEIRITFPDEHDESTGRRKSGRVLVVRVGDTSVGLEPLQDEDQLPAYEKETSGRFTSIDMDRIGGLKEKSTFEQ